MKKSFLLLIMALMACSSVSAVIIQSMETDKAEYADGDLVQLRLFINSKDAVVRADFTQLDSKFNQASVLVEHTADFLYEVYYPISFDNTRSDGVFNILVTVFENVSSSTVTANYAIKLSNTAAINRSSVSDTVRISVGETGQANTTIYVESGYILVCTGGNRTKCDKLSKADYDATRNFVITSGKVTLSNLTYEQLKAEIIESVNARVNKDIQQYLNLMIQANKDMKASLERMEAQYQNNSVQFINMSAANNESMKRFTWLNIGLAFLTIALIITAFYIFYLKTHTTWLDW